MEKGPLSGKLVVVTRPREQTESFAERLRAAGAEVLEIPLIRIEPPEDETALKKAARDVARFDWVVFTSANGVTRFGEALEEVRGGWSALEGVAVCAVGPATAEALERSGRKPDLVPETYLGEGLAAALRARADLRGRQVLYPRAEGARPVLAESLRRAGAAVHEVIAYRTTGDPEGARELRARMELDEIDVVTFTSASAVRQFAQLGGGKGRALVASIGPVTSAEAATSRIAVDIEATEHTTEGLTAAIVAHFGREEFG